MSTAPSFSVPILSLFSGAGGLDTGFLQCGFIPIVALDHDETAVKTFNANFPGSAARVTDLGSMTASDLIELMRDIDTTPKGVIGGPPCQGFSRGNIGAAENDPRNAFALRYAELISRLHQVFPLDFVVLENVAGLTYPRHKSRLESIHKSLDSAGFEVFEMRLEASNYGVPQLRERLFLVGIDRERFPGVRLSHPTPSSKKMTVRDVIWGLPEPIFYKTGMSPCDIPHHPNHWTMRPVSERFVNQDFNRGRSFRRLEWDKPSWTVAYGNREIHVHPDGRRRLSILEAMMIQQFPADFVLKGSFSKQVQQVSNAVPPPLASAVATSLAKHLYAQTPGV